eukprot:4019006-Lingulodinium_polyedra.AAC.1
MREGIPPHLRPMDNAIPKDVLDEQETMWAVQRRPTTGGPRVVRRRVHGGAKVHQTVARAARQTVGGGGQGGRSGRGEA